LQNFRNDENYNELNAVDDVLRLFIVGKRYFYKKGDMLPIKVELSLAPAEV